MGRPMGKVGDGDIFDPQTTTESKYPTALFWNRCGTAVIILFTLVGIGTCRAIGGDPVQPNEGYVSPTPAGDIATNTSLHAFAVRSMYAYLPSNGE